MASNRYSIEVNRILSQEIWTIADITHVMTQYRLLIQDNGLQEKYNFLNLYCNWTLHTRISGSMTAFRILEYFSDCIINSYEDPGNSKWINDAIVEGFSLHKLHDEILKIGQEFEISASSKFTEHGIWIPFGRMVVDNLDGKPLSFPNPINALAKRTYDSILEKAEKSGNLEQKVVNEFSFFKDKHSWLHSWEIKTIDSVNRGYRIMGQVAFINQKMVDDLNRTLSHHANRPNLNL